MALKINVNEIIRDVAQGAKEMAGKQKCPGDCDRTITSVSDLKKAVQKGLSNEGWAESCDTIEDGTNNSDHDYDYQCKDCKTGIDITWTGAVR